MLYVAGSAVAATVKHLLALTDANGVVVAAKPKWVCGVVCTQDRARATVDLLFERPMYVAPFERVPGLGRFILRDEGVIMGMGRILELKQKHCCVCWDTRVFIVEKGVIEATHIQQIGYSFNSRSFRCNSSIALSEVFALSGTCVGS